MSFSTSLPIFRRPAAEFEPLRAPVGCLYYGSTRIAYQVSTRLSSAKIEDGKEEDEGETSAEPQILNPGLQVARPHFCDLLSGEPVSCHKKPRRHLNCLRLYRTNASVPGGTRSLSPVIHGHLLERGARFAERVAPEGGDGSIRYSPKVSAGSCRYKTSGIGTSWFTCLVVAASFAVSVTVGLYGVLVREIIKSE